MPPHDRAIRFADLSALGDVVVLVDDKPRHADDAVRLSTCGGDDRHDIRERGFCLPRQVVADEPLLVIPAYLAADEHERAAGRDAVRVAGTSGPTGGFDDLHLSGGLLA